MDTIICCILNDFPVRFYIAVTTQTIQAMNIIHKTTPTAAAAAGRTLTGALLLAAMMKNSDDVLTVTVKGDGEIKRIVATANNHGEGKCDILNPETGIYLNSRHKLDVSRVVGRGSLTVVKDIGLKQAYMGQVELVSGEIAEDFAYYLAKSEQTPSIVSLGVFVRKDYSVAAAGGFMIQLMPDCPEDMIIYLEKKVSEIEPVTSMLLHGYDATDIAKEIFKNFKYSVLKKTDARYKCGCSEDKIYKVLLALGKEELEDIRSQNEDIEIRCHFCNTAYTVSTEKIDRILKEINEK